MFFSFVLFGNVMEKKKKRGKVGYTQKYLFQRNVRNYVKRLYLYGFSFRSHSNELNEEFGMCILLLSFSINPFKITFQS
ncbi:hypothetical protein Hdeb2414_s0025g00661061 [Helianthus debilis subsp. tardiflorus]